MVKNLKFDYMYYDEVATSVEIIDGVVSFINYTDNLTNRAFGVRKSVTLDYIDKFFEERCFPKTRKSAKELLKHLEVPYYEPFLICKKTHGVILGDYSWIRFEGETLTWEDVRIKS